VDKQRAWAFYRACAADPQHVWAAACTAWTSKGISDKEAAAIMRLGWVPAPCLMRRTAPTP